MVGRLRAFVQTLGAGAFCVAVLAAGAAIAAPERIPLSGAPAMQIEVAAGWSARRDDEGNLFIIADDHSGVVVLNMVSQPGVGDVPLDQVATAILSQAKADPASTGAAVTLDGHAGRAFTSRIPANNANLRLMLVRLDSAHLASVTTLSRDAMTPEQTAGLAAEAASVKILTTP